MIDQFILIDIDSDSNVGTQNRVSAQSIISIVSMCTNYWLRLEDASSMTGLAEFIANDEDTDFQYLSVWTDNTNMVAYINFTQTKDREQSKKN